MAQFTQIVDGAVFRMQPYHLPSNHVLFPLSHKCPGAVASRLWHHLAGHRVPRLPRHRVISSAMPFLTLRVDATLPIIHVGNRISERPWGFPNITQLVDKPETVCTSVASRHRLSQAPWWSGPPFLPFFTMDSLQAQLRGVFGQFCHVN